MMKKKLLYLTGGICGVLLIVSLIFTITTAALESTGLPHSAVQTEPGVWEIRSRHELIPMLHELMKDKADADPVYETAQERMFVLIVALWLIFTAVCLTVAFTTKRYVRWTAFLIAFLGCFACTMVLNEVVSRIPIC